MRLPVVCLALSAIVPSILTGCGDSGSGDGDDTTSTAGTTLTTTPAGPYITALHHNPHWECMQNSSCRAGATEQFDGFLETYDVDFASLVMGGNNYSRTDSRWKSVTSVSGPDPKTADTATLIWDDQKWELLDSIETEFESTRAAVLGLFQSRDNQALKLGAASLHYPHHVKSAKEVADAKAVGEKITALWGDAEVGPMLFMGDTNVAQSNMTIHQQGSKWWNMTNAMTSEELVQQFKIPPVSVQSTEPLPTCCGDWPSTTPEVPFALTYDRIFSTLDCKLTTMQDPDYKAVTKNYNQTPAWVDGVFTKNNPSNAPVAYHHPILARLFLPETVAHV